MLSDEEIDRSELAADAIDDGVNENEFLTRFKENLRHLPEMLKNEEIASLMLSNGFTIKPGMSDLKDYVYTAARAIESAATAPLLARIAELEAQNNLLHRLMVSGEWRGVEKGLEESSTRIAELERELEEARKDAERWNWLNWHIGVAWGEEGFTSLIRIVSEKHRALINTQVDKLMAGELPEAPAIRAAIKEQT